VLVQQPEDDRGIFRPLGLVHGQRVREVQPVQLVVGVLHRVSVEDDAHRAGFRGRDPPDVPVEHPFS
jgi:hypothetical protein